MYRYDAWNRLVGVWYADAGGTGDAYAGQRVAAYAYDALFRRVSKTVSNQGLGCVHGSDAGGMAGIQAGDRAEHYFYSGWRLIEERDGSDRTLAQTVFGTQYIDEPVCRDRNTDPVAGGSADNDCLDSGGSQRYFYHQDANYRVTLLTGETGGVVERYDYSAYGEPAVFGGAIRAPRRGRCAGPSRLPSKSSRFRAGPGPRWPDTPRPTNAAPPPRPVPAPAAQASAA